MMWFREVDVEVVVVSPRNEISLCVSWQNSTHGPRLSNCAAAVLLTDQKSCTKLQFHFFPTNSNIPSTKVVLGPPLNAVNKSPLRAFSLPWRPLTRMERWYVFRLQVTTFANV
jgi:hypothetical protein